MAPDMVVIHYTGMESAEAALARLCAPETEVSAHWLIDEDGRLFRLVDESRRAWHAGVAAWGAVRDVNSHSVGVELANPGPDGGLPPFPEAQMAALEALLFRIKLRWGIPAERVLGHSDVAVGRKIDPGPRFDWGRLVGRGLAAGSAAEGTADPADPAALAGPARAAGYHWADLGALAAALQLRLAPDEAGGPPSGRLLARVADLAARHPVSDGRMP